MELLACRSLDETRQRHVHDGVVDDHDEHDNTENTRAPTNDDRAEKSAPRTSNRTMFHYSRTMFYTCQVMERTTRTPSDQIGPDVLCAAALAILDDEGPDGFTVRAIAQRAGVAPMAIYNHFDGVNGVLEALWIEGFDRLRHAISLRFGFSAEEDLLNAGRGYRRFALENRGLYTVMFMHRFRNFEPSLEAAQAAAQTFDALVANVERCQLDDLFRGVHARDVAQVVWSACHGYVSLELLGINFAADRDATFELLLATLQGRVR